MSLHQQCSTTYRLKNEWISAAPANKASPHWKMDGWMDYSRHLLA